MYCTFETNNKIKIFKKLLLSYNKISKKDSHLETHWKDLWGTKLRKK